MKIELQKFLGFHFNENMKKVVYDTQYKNGVSFYKDEEFIKNSLVKLEKFLNDDNNKFYLVTKSADNIIDNIKTEKGFDMTFLHGLEQNKKITFLIDEKTMYRYFIFQDEIFAIWIGIKPGNLNLSYTTFKINTKDGFVTFPDNQLEPLSDERFKFFIRLLIFTEFSKTELKVLNPKQKTGTRKSGKFLNNTNKSITIVDSTWNIIIKTGAFGVSGHIRLQRVGKDRASVKLVYIDSYSKSGYTRLAKKESV